MDIVLWGPLWQPHTLPYPFTKTWVFSWALAWEAEGRSQKGFTTDPEQAVIQGNKNLVSLHLSKLGNFLKGLVPLRNNQGSVLRQITVFSHETMTKKRGPKCNVFGKIFSGCIDLDPSSKTLHHFDSCEKSSKSNLDSLTCNRSYIRKNPIERFGCGKPLSYSSFCSVPEKIHIGMKSHAHSQCEKVINHKQAHIQYKKVQVGEKQNVCSVWGKGRHRGQVRRETASTQLAAMWEGASNIRKKK